MQDGINKEDNSFTKLIAMFPFIRITHNKDNESRSYYSFIALLSVVGDILKCMEKEEMIGRINDLKLFRSYQMPQDEVDSVEDERFGGDDYGVETRQDEIIALADIMHQWKEAYRDCLLPPYALGRIMTRLYSSLSNVAVSSVGQMMNVMVANFFNSCLIEETKIRISAQEQSKINNSNLRADTRYFKDNLGKSDIVNQLKFTKWIMSCPMLNCFLDDETHGKVEEFVVEELKKEKRLYSVYELLCKINSKDGGDASTVSKPLFSGEKTSGWKDTVEVLRKNGINDDMIHEKIANEKDIDKAIEYVKSTNLFRRVSKHSIESFSKYFLLAAAVITAESQHTDNGNE